MSSSCPISDADVTGIIFPSERMCLRSAVWTGMLSSSAMFTMCSRRARFAPFAKMPSRRSSDLPAAFLANQPFADELYG